MIVAWGRSSLEASLLHADGFLIQASIGLQIEVLRTTNAHAVRKFT